MSVIYEPRGMAKEYADLALNIYTGCTHRCSYCYAPRILRKDPEEFASNVIVRKGMLEQLERDLERNDYTGKLVHLCFTCDPYPTGVGTEATRKVIEMIHDVGAFVQILTKNTLSAMRDIDLLGEGDVFGTTITGARPEEEPNAERDVQRLSDLHEAHARGLRTWVSCEPVMDPGIVLHLIENEGWIDRISVGKLNYAHSDIDWSSFARDVLEAAKDSASEVVLKDSLKAKLFERASAEGPIRS